MGLWGGNGGWDVDGTRNGFAIHHASLSATCPRGTILELAIELDKSRLHIQGKVAVVNPTSGMGIEFIEI